MKKKLVGSCLNCKWREGTRCNKSKEYIDLADWCARYSEKKDKK
jgi:hypothetical protein